MQPSTPVELPTLELGHQRRNQRAIQILEDLIEHPGASIPAACGTLAKTKAAYRFLDSDYVKSNALRKAQADATVQRMAGLEQVLVAQDTTSLDFTTHPATTGLGVLDHSACRGLLVHSALALNPQGVPLGVLHQQVWVRAEEKVGRQVPRRQRATSEKESQRWLDTVEGCQACIPTDVQAVIIGDREADIFDLFAMERGRNIDLLVRSAHQHRRVRSVSQPDRHLSDSVRASPWQGELIIEVQRATQGTAKRAARQAQMDIRFQELELLPPRNGKSPDGKRRQSNPEAATGIKVTAVLVEERHPPSGVTPLCWLLLTTVKITTSEEAQQCVHWYAQRWKVERYHFVLKSGCGVEQLQLETRERLERALALYSIVAWRLLWLTYQARETPEASCTVVLRDDEWKALWITVHRSKNLPQKPPNLQQAVKWIAQLGGFLARKGDGEPGVKVLWRGLRRLHDITETYLLMSKVLGNG